MDTAGIELLATTDHLHPEANMLTLLPADGHTLPDQIYSGSCWNQQLFSLCSIKKTDGFSNQFKQLTEREIHQKWPIRAESWLKTGVMKPFQPLGLFTGITIEENIFEKM